MKISEDYLRCVGRGKTGKILLLCSWGAAVAGGCCGGNEVAKWVHLPLLLPPPATCSPAPCSARMSPFVVHLFSHNCPVT